LLEQRLVVLLGGLERIRAHDRLARIVAIAVAPRGRRRRIVADQAGAVRAPLLLERDRAVAAEVARIAPEVAVLVEILGREEIDLERLDARRGVAVAGGADAHVRIEGGTVRAERDRDIRADDFVLAQI